MNLSYCGIDVCKAHLDVHVLPGGQVRRIANTSAGHRELIKFLSGFEVGLVVLEATGGYERAAVVAMVNAKLPVHVAQPQVTHAFAVSLRLRAKNDQIDALVCARYAQDRCKDLPVIKEIDATLETLKALVMRRDELVTMQTMEKNRVQQALDKAGLASIKRMLGYFEKEIARVEKLIDQMIKADEELRPKARKLQETVGVGAQTARLLIALLPELGTVSPKRLNALVGVAPYAADSGDKAGARHIAGGRQVVRNGLYMACLTAAYINPVVAAYYQRLIGAGHEHKTAMVACIRKLLAHLDRQIRSLEQGQATQAA